MHNSKLAKGEPSWGSVDKAKLPSIAFARKGTKAERGFPHHWVKGGGPVNAEGIYTTGTLYLHHGGLNAAWSAANGARSGQKAEPAVLAHLRRHLADIGQTKAAMVKDIPGLDLDQLDEMLIKAGLVTAEQIADSHENRVARLMKDFEHITFADWPA